MEILKRVVALFGFLLACELHLAAWQGERQWTEAPCGETRQYIDEKGRVRLTIEAHWTKHFYEGRAAIARNNQWGFIDESGRVVIPLKYSQVGRFSEGSAWVCTGSPAAKSCGFIDPDGKDLTPLRYVETWPARAGVMFGKYAEGLHALSPHGEILANLPAGCDPGTFGEGYLACKTDSGSVIRDLVGRTIDTPPLHRADGFYGGWAAVQLRETRRWTFLNRQGRLLPGPSFRFVGRFSEGLAPVCLEDRWGFVDQAGRMVIPPQYFSANPFYRGRALVATSHYKGFVDHAGKLVIPDVLLEVYEGFEETGLARSILPTGYVDKTYDRSRRLPPGAFPTSYPFGYIDLNGTVVWQCTPEDGARSRREKSK